MLTASCAPLRPHTRVSINTWLPLAVAPARCKSPHPTPPIPALGFYYYYFSARHSKQQLTAGLPCHFDLLPFPTMQPCSRFQKPRSCWSPSRVDFLFHLAFLRGHVLTFTFRKRMSKRSCDKKQLSVPLLRVIKPHNYIYIIRVQVTTSLPISVSVYCEPSECTIPWTMATSSPQTESPSYLNWLVHGGYPYSALSGPGLLKPVTCLGMWRNAKEAHRISSLYYFTFQETSREGSRLSVFTRQLAKNSWQPFWLTGCLHRQLATHCSCCSHLSRPHTSGHDS